MIRVNGTELYCEDTGGDGEPIIFSHGLLLDTCLFSPQVEALKATYRCISYDHRGQGRSADVSEPLIDMDTLCDDVIALIEKLDLGPVHFCGLSMGGFVAMRLAARHPHLVRSLILCSTSADPETNENKKTYKVLNFFAKWFGPKYVVSAVVPIMYAKSALNDPKRKEQVKEWREQLGRNRRSIWRAVNGIIYRKSVYHELEKITAPTLVMVGEEDVVATVPAKAVRLANAIRGAKLVRVPRAGHSLTIEQPEAANREISHFLQELSKAKQAL